MFVWASHYLKDATLRKLHWFLLWYGYGLPALHKPSKTSLMRSQKLLAGVIFFKFFSAWFLLGEGLAPLTKGRKKTENFGRTLSPLFSSVQSLSCVQLFVAPWTAACQASLHQLSKLVQTPVYRVSDAIQTSHPLSFPSPPAFSLSQHQGLFQWVSSFYQVAKVLEFQLQHQSFQWIFRTDFL